MDIFLNKPIAVSLFRPRNRSVCGNSTGIIFFSPTVDLFEQYREAKLAYTGPPSSIPHHLNS